MTPLGAFRRLPRKTTTSAPLRHLLFLRAPTLADATAAQQAEEKRETRQRAVSVGTRDNKSERERCSFGARDMAGRVVEYLEDLAGFVDASNIPYLRLRIFLFSKEK